MTIAMKYLLAAREEQIGTSDDYLPIGTTFKGKCPLRGRTQSGADSGLSALSQHHCPRRPHPCALADSDQVYPGREMRRAVEDYFVPPRPERADFALRDATAGDVDQL